MSKLYDKYKDYVVVYGFAILFFVFDIITKYFIVRCGNILFKKEVIKNFFYIDYVTNNGAAFSMFSNNTIILIITAIVSLLLINKFLLKKDLNVLQIMSYSLMIGGILGNLFDRCFNGYVIDFLSFKFGSYYFPIFNFADVFIVVGGIILIINILMEDKHERSCSNR